VKCRDQLGTPTLTDVIIEGQALARNLSIAGAKVEDTILSGSQSNEILTVTPERPVMSSRIPGHENTIQRALVTAC
jgi:hypothetical protein